MRVSIAQTRQVAKKLGVNLDKTDVHELRRGIEVEHEHKNVIGNSMAASAKVALAHLKEYPDYYTRLRIVESKKKLY
jgi:hypothetical protein